MKQFLRDFLICPACLQDQIPLDLISERSEGDDILEGALVCTGCGRQYAIVDGTADFVAHAPHRETDPYETPAMTATYLWAQFADWFDPPDTEASGAYVHWHDLLANADGPMVDVGCGVGRLALSLGDGTVPVVGVDRSRPFIRAARQLAANGHLTFPLRMEGRITEPRTIHLPSHVCPNVIEFIVADALRLPFRDQSFSRVATVNLIDKVPRPLDHLVEINRIATATNAAWLFADPFSWSETVASPERWLGGTDQGAYCGSGLKNVRRLLEGCNGAIIPAWQLTKTEVVHWRLRTHPNHSEQIRSQTFLAGR